MVDLSEIQAAYYMVAATGVIVAAIYYILNIRTNKTNQELMLKAQQQTLETRQAQLLMQIFDKISNKDYREDFMETVWNWKFDSYEDYITNIGSNTEKVARLTHVWDTLGGVGVLLENKLVDPKMVYHVLGWEPILCWEKYEPIIKEWGRRTGEPKMFPGFEFLYGELSWLYEEEHGYRYGHKVRTADDALASLMDDKKSTRI
jgi:hypothetical protein